jgi:hypothetical protein
MSDKIYADDDETTNFHRLKGNSNLTTVDCVLIRPGENPY